MNVVPNPPSDAAPGSAASGPGGVPADPATRRELLAWLGRFKLLVTRSLRNGSWLDDPIAEEPPDAGRFSAPVAGMPFAAPAPRPSSGQAPRAARPGDAGHADTRTRRRGPVAVTNAGSSSTAMASSAPAVGPLTPVARMPKPGLPGPERATKGSRLLMAVGWGALLAFAISLISSIVQVLLLPPLEEEPAGKPCAHEESSCPR